MAVGGMGGGRDGGGLDPRFMFRLQHGIGMRPAGSMKPRDQREMARGAWENYQQWRRDIQERYESQEARARARAAAGGMDLSSDVFQAQLRQMEGERDRELREIDEGPTRGIVEDMWAGDEALMYETGAWEVARERARESLDRSAFMERIEPEAPGTEKGPYDGEVKYEFQASEFHLALDRETMSQFQQLKGDTEARDQWFEDQFGMPDEDLDTEDLSARQARQAGSGRRRGTGGGDSGGGSPWL